eukprot:5075868-Pleurochrysis_carterae.AAC.1
MRQAAIIPMRLPCASVSRRACGDAPSTLRRIALACVRARIFWSLPLGSHPDSPVPVSVHGHAQHVLARTRRACAGRASSHAPPASALVRRQRVGVPARAWQCVRVGASAPPPRWKRGACAGLRASQLPVLKRACFRARALARVR